jgi:hypothetical protein
MRENSRAVTFVMEDIHKLGALPDSNHIAIPKTGLPNLDVVDGNAIQAVQIDDGPPSFFAVFDLAVPGRRIQGGVCMALCRMFRRVVQSVTIYGEARQGTVEIS